MASGDISKRLRTGSALNIKYAVQNLIDIYKDNWDYIIDEELQDQVGLETYEKFRWLVTKELNILKRVVKELSLVYAEPPERKAVLPKENTEDNQTEEQLDENYTLSQEDTVKDLVLQNINHYTNLINHTLLKVTYRDAKLDYDQINFNNAEIFTAKNDWMKVVAVKHYHGYQFPNNNYIHNNKPALKLTNSEGLAVGTVQNYTEAKIWVIEDVESVGIIENDDYDELKGGFVYTVKTIGGYEVITKTEEIVYKDDEGNPILPFVLYNKSFPVDETLDFTTGNDLRDLNINVAMMMIYINTLVKYQSFKQLVFNTDDPESITDLKLGPADALVNPTREGNGSVQVLDLQARVMELYDLVKNRTMTTLSGYGVAPDNFTMSASPSSGFSLMISNMGKLESRKSQLPTYQIGEQKLFKIEKIIWNYHRPDAPISSDAKLMVDFVEPHFPMSPEEKVKSAEFGLMHNLITEIDLLMKKNPDLTKEEAEKLYAENKIFNEANKPRVAIAPAQQPQIPVEDGSNRSDNT
jgi:hypothetical protein